MTISFVEGGDGITVHDRVQGVEYHLGIETSRSLEGDDYNTRSSPESFTSPVDNATVVRAEKITLSAAAHVFVRDAETHESVVTSQVGDDKQAPVGEYEIEIASAPMKLYLAVSGAPVLISHNPGKNQTTLTFAKPTEIEVGGRSHHEVPAGTITTTSEPEDLMRAVSYFGTGLKTFSPERTFPTLRGHPPKIELGEEFEVPAEIEESATDTGITLRVPRDQAAVYAVSPLAYYLGASVKPADDGEARLEIPAEDVQVPLTDHGTSYQSATAVSTRDSPSSEISTGANTLLTHLFTLDCTVRTEGLYDVPVAVQETVTSELPDEFKQEFDLSTLYEMSLAERTAAYLQVPQDRFEEALEWPFSAAVASIPENIGLLPSMAYELAHIFVPPPSNAPPESMRASQENVEAIEDFHRDGDHVSEPLSEGLQDREPGAFPGIGEGEILSPPPLRHRGQIWAAPHFPVGTIKPSAEAYQRSLEREPSDTAIEIQVVCNNEDMAAEVPDLYGFREWMTFNIDIAHDLSQDELREVLHEDHDFFHYIGHIQNRGIQCSDGFLDVRTIEETGVEAFLLNGCRSYRQGMELINAGSLGGFVTTEHVGNNAATTVGRLLAGLLDSGFPLYAALDVLQSELGRASRYSILGNGIVTLSPSGGFPTLTVVNQVSNGEVKATPIVYPTRRIGFGSLCVPNVGEDQMYVGTGRLETVSLSVPQFVERLKGDRNPVLIGGEIVWGNTSNLEELLTAADQTTPQSVADVLCTESGSK